MKIQSMILSIIFLMFASIAMAGPVPTWDKQINGPNRFKVLNDFDRTAVLDKETGLVWEQSPSTSTFDWFFAQGRCNNLTLGNRKGWRLPTLQELESLVDPSQSNPSLPVGNPFDNVQSSDYWSATSNVVLVNFAWTVNFANGNPGFLDKLNSRAVWCVRGGQGMDSQ